MLSLSACRRAACIAALALCAAPASADDANAYINWANLNELVVLSDGQNYTKLDTPIIGDFLLRGRLEYDTNAAGNIKSWSATPIMSTGYGINQEVPGLSAYKMSKSYGVGSRPSEIGKNLEFAIPYSVIDDLAIAMCQWKAFALRDEGQTDKQIFGKNREVSFKILLDWNVDATGAGSGNLVLEPQDPFVLPIRCAKWTGAQVPQGGNGALEDALRILSAQLSLTEETTLNGVCRVKTTTTVKANKANATIKYRFVHSSGKKSTSFKIKTGADKTALIEGTWDIPNEDGKETGWLRVEGVGTDFKTDKASYSMDCAAKAPGGLTPDTPRVLTAKLILTEETTLNGVCRVKTATALRTDKANATISYRFVHSSGKTSPTFKIKTEANKIAVINRTWDVPNEDGPETGWFQVEGVGTDFQTAKVFYNMDCPAKAPGGTTFDN